MNIKHKFSEIDFSDGLDKANEQIEKNEFEMNEEYKGHETKKKCPKCGGFLHKEVHKEIDYPLVCLEDDEHFYEFEAYE